AVAFREPQSRLPAFFHSGVRRAVGDVAEKESSDVPLCVFTICCAADLLRYLPASALSCSDRTANADLGSWPLSRGRAPNACPGCVHRFHGDSGDHQLMPIIASRKFATDSARPLRRLSIVLPVYNEKGSIAAIIERVLRSATPLEHELVIVDDYSQDGTREALPELIRQARSAFPSARLELVLHSVNQGKGAALRTGFKHSTGDVILIQDADLEYDPRDYPQLLEPILEGYADVVFGNRFHGGSHRVLYF